MEKYVSLDFDSDCKCELGNRSFLGNLIPIETLNGKCIFIRLHGY